MTDIDSPVRVGRFEWERLMLIAVPHPQNFKLLPIGIFMSADGGRARPGNAGLAMFGPHEKTWAKLLRWAVSEGWLVLVERGGARRGAGGKTIVRASVYAASVPRQVWERRSEILAAPPFRSASFEGSAPDAADPLKGAVSSPSGGPDPLKGASTAPFNAPDASMKGAPGCSLPDSLKGAFGVFEGSDPSFEGSAQTLPHHVVPSRSPSSSTSSPAPSSTAGPKQVPQGGGGGDSSSEDQTAEPLVAALDYRGRPPGNKQRAKLISLVAAALTAGWSEQDLKTYLDLGGSAVNSAAAVYVHRLDPGELPDSQSFREAARRPLEGTDANVAGWAALPRQLGGHKPFDGGGRDCMNEAARNGDRPSQDLEEGDKRL